jgi:tetrathionate reductase subunit B
MKLAMVIDSSRCIDCKACLVSCATANSVPTGKYRNWVREKSPDLSAAKPGGHFQPGACMHCRIPTCVKACLSGASFRRADTSEVVIDAALCIGCGNCLPACPYDARYIHDKKRTADKCDYCASRRAQGFDPACVGTCPTRARVFGDVDDAGSAAAKRLASGRHVLLEYPGSPTQPLMFYMKQTAPDDWLRKPEAPASMRFLTAWAAPAIHALMGLAGMGIMAVFARRMLLPDSKNSTAEQGNDHA